MKTIYFLSAFTMLNANAFAEKVSCEFGELGKGNETKTIAFADLKANPLAGLLRKQNGIEYRVGIREINWTKQDGSKVLLSKNGLALTVIKNDQSASQTASDGKHLIHLDSGKKFGVHCWID